MYKSYICLIKSSHLFVIPFFFIYRFHIHREVSISEDIDRIHFLTK